MSGKSNLSGNGTGNEKEESDLKNAMKKTQQFMATDYRGISGGRRRPH